MNEINSVSDAGFESRWAAWVTKGREQDRRFRRQMAVVAPIALVVAAVVAAILRFQ